MKELQWRTWRISGKVLHTATVGSLPGLSSQKFTKAGKHKGVLLQIFSWNISLLKHLRLPSLSRAVARIGCCMEATQLHTMGRSLHRVQGHEQKEEPPVMGKETP